MAHHIMLTKLHLANVLCNILIKYMYNKNKYMKTNISSKKNSKNVFLFFVFMLIFITGFLFFDILQVNKVFAVINNSQTGNIIIDKILPGTTAPSCGEHGCSCDTDAYLDEYNGDVQCIGENDVSRRESANINNIKKVVGYLDYIRKNTIPNWTYLISTGVINTLTNASGSGKMDLYYLSNKDINVSTVQAVARSGRDVFFRDKYSSYVALSKSIDLISRYNNLSGSIQNLVELLNTTNEYIAGSSVNQNLELSRGIEEKANLLNDYIDRVNLNVQTFNFALSGLNNMTDINRVNTFINNFGSNNSGRGYFSSFNSINEEYGNIRDGIIQIAMDAITAVEVAQNKNSSITASPKVITNNGLSASTVSVTIRDSLNNPKQGKKVFLTLSDNSINRSVNIKSINSVTDYSGVAQFQITSTQTGYISLRANIDGENFELLATNIINVGAIGIDPRLLETLCKQSGGTWNSSLKDPCTCPSGYIYDSKTGKCVKVSKPLNL